MAWTCVQPTGFSSVDASERLREALAAAGYDVTADDARVIATGYGRVAVPYAHKVVTEITCHGTGAVRLFGDHGTVIDVGGQDTKVIQLKGGRVAKFAMNDKCAAGTGRFLEIMADRLGISQQQMADLARSGEPTKISSMCTVFAESEVISLIGVASRARTLTRGVIESVVSRVATMAGQAAGAPYYLTGGLCENAYVVERLGSYSDTWSAGLHVKIPFIERIAKKVSLKEQVADFPPQPVITRDNVTMQIDTVVFFQVMDAKLYTYGVNQPIAAIESLSATTLRNIIGEMELDHTLTSRDVINGKITAILDEATDKWGIKVNRVEVKNIIPPREIQEAMEKQMKAEREKRAVILKADGEKQAAITAAEGEKEAAILRADAVKQQRILEAEGEAQAILAVQKANADAIRLLNEAMPSDKVLAIRSLEALAKVANGKATKIIIPS